MSPDAFSGRHRSLGFDVFVIEQSTSSLKELVSEEPEKLADNAEKPSRRERWPGWLHYLIAIIVLFLSCGGAVADQQLSKLVNSEPTFNAPFFFLWFAGVVRSFVYPIYLLFRAALEYRKARQATSSRPVYGMKFAEISRNLTREAVLAFGKDGITWHSFFRNILPFSLTWIATNGLFYWAITFAPVSESITIGSSFIVITYIASWIWLKEKVLIVKILGMVVCLTGVALTAYASGTTIGQTEGSWIAAVLTTGSAVSLALTTVAFKKLYGTPNFNQIAMYVTATSLTNAVVSWPLFLALKLSDNEIWELVSAPWGLMTASSCVSSGSSTLYYVATSWVSPAFISLSRPLQILLNYGIDIATGTVVFEALSAVGTLLVLVGFLILVLPDKLVSVDLRAPLTRLRPAKKFFLTPGEVSDYETKAPK